MLAKSTSGLLHADKIWVHLFIRSSGALLLVMAWVNLIHVSTNSHLLFAFDPLLGIPFRYAVLMVGGMELLVALFCLFGRRASLQAVLVAWLMTNFAMYQIGLIWQGSHTQWVSLGNPLETLSLLPNAADRGMYFILAGLLFGCYAALIWLWWESRTALPRSQAAPIESLKMSCPSCGVHIKFAVQNLGQQIPCPQCQKEITLRKPDFLKTVCFFCKEHIEFPTHAIGQKIQCPHCKKDITLLIPV